MRKRLLRSRSGFEKPESREEAIMQNILGASNVLEPSESNIEEILKSILYNTPYTKEAEYDIEKILLAIKNNGTYDGEVESRDMKILLAILRDSTYNEEPESRIEELFIEWLQQRQQIKVLEGVPPLTFPARGLPLINYLIEGNTVQNGGVGERTWNLWNKLGFSANPINSSGVHATTNSYGTTLSTSTGSSVEITQIASGGNTNYQNGFFFIEIDFSQFSIGDAFVISFDYEITNKLTKLNTTVSYVGQSTTGTNVIADWSNSGRAVIKATFDSSMTKPYVEIRLCGNSIKVRNVQITLGSITLPYKPYGYKIPITCGGVTTDIYIGDSPLYDGDTISMTDTGIEIPTAYGNNVLTVDTTVQPSNVYIEYK